MFFYIWSSPRTFWWRYALHVRDDMKASPQATIEAVAALGYEYVELAGYADGKFYGMEPAAFKALLAKYGLKAVSSHQGTVNLENADQMIADVKAAGIEYLSSRAAYGYVYL